MTGYEELKGKRILIGGGGISGVGAAGLLGKAGFPSAVYDAKPDFDREAFLDKLPPGLEISFELPFSSGQKPDSDKVFSDLAKKYDLLVISPGFPLNQPLVRAFLDREKAVWGEVELAAAFSRGRICAITGTNGKTTTTSLVGAILKEYYSSVFVVGNIGVSFTSAALATRPESVIAAEISSFQLETTHRFHPAVSAVLNVTPDHLDRHGTMEEYAKVKCSIAKNQTKEEPILLNYDNPITRAMADKTPARPVMFSRLADLSEGILLTNQGDRSRFVIRENGQEIPICDCSQVRLKGSHNHENILAAIGIAWYMGVPAAIIRKAVLDFRAVAHRIEYVDTVDGVDYYNDSKGTNPDAAIRGICAMDRPTVLLGGGYDKNADYEDWIRSFDGKVKWLILMGATAAAIGQTAKKLGFGQLIYVDSLEEAMDRAREKACPGDAVLLSPACASWGMFPNYEVRGDRFKEIVRSFKE